MTRHLSRQASAPPEPLAIIGIGCRFPGASGPLAFWHLIRDGVDAITEVPADRFDVDAVYDPRRPASGKIYSRWGGFLPAIDRFDPYFFGISPREATRMDPQHRLLLEVAWEALEDAGQPAERLAGQPVGVFAGMCTSDYEDLIEDPADLDIYATAGNARSVLAGRLSYALGLEGPSVVVDTACSSSLVAVHLACQSLWSGESRVALAAGANLVLRPETSMGFCQAQMLASDGRCKVFDARGDGFVRSDGVAVVVLKPLAAALADRDPVYAVIRGSAANNDGKSGGLLMTPSQPGQEAVLRAAYRHAGVSPGDVQYVEAHGTGTVAGDPVEAQALGAVLAEGRAAGRPCLVGSVKTNIGHTEAAAGVAGLIKAALCIKHRAIPPSLHFSEPNPNIPWAELPLLIPQALVPWPADARPALAGVSSFGISGTNVHVVLESAPAGSDVSAAVPRDELLALSAHSLEALRDQARGWRTLAAGEAAPALADAAYTASVRRTHHDHRLALVARSWDEVVERLDAFLEDEARPGLVAGRRIPGAEPGVVFVFPGQGSQWIGMARDLAEREPAFREALERCDRAMRDELGWSVAAVLTAASPERFDNLDVVQPLLFAVQVSLAALWRAWGVEPVAVVGHSMGEMAAAHVAGILSLEDAARVVCRRGRILGARASGHGGMAVLELPPDAIGELLAGHGDRVAVAAYNGPTTTVISGERDALDAIRREASRRDVFCPPVRIDYAPHSPLVDPLLDEVRAALDGIRPGPGDVPMISTVTARRLDGRACDASYWVANLREPVRFTEALALLAAEGDHVFVELSAHPVLGVAIAAALRHHGVAGAALPSLRRGEDGRATMLESLGGLHAAGYPVDWTRQHPEGGRCVSLPAYPWQRERFWLEARAAADDLSTRAMLRRGDHPLLGRHFRTSIQPGTHLWESDIDVRRLGYLDDHRLQGTALLPAAAYVEMAAAAAARVFREGRPLVEGLTLKQALFLGEGPRRVQVAVTPLGPDEVGFQLFGLSPGDDGEPAWTLHAAATLRAAPADSPGTRPVEPLDAIRARCPELLSGETFYALLRGAGLEFGPSFQGLEEIHRRDGEALGRLRFSEAVAAERRAYGVHPALLDAGFQAVGGAVPLAGGLASRDLLLPVGIDAVRIHRPIEGPLWSHARLREAPGTAGGVVEADVLLLDAGGEIVVETRGLRLARLDAKAATAPPLDEALYEIRWCPLDRPATPTVAGGSWLICLDQRGVGEALSAALEARGERCVIVTAAEAYRVAGPGRFEAAPASADDLARIVAEAFGPDAPPCSGVVHLWSLDAPPPGDDAGSIAAATRLTCASVLHLVQAVAVRDGAPPPRLWIVTSGLHDPRGDGADVGLAQAPVWGLGGVVASEHPELRCARVDLSPACAPEELRSLLDELSLGAPVDQVALRGTTRYVPRLTRLAPEPGAEIRRAATEDEAFYLEVPRRGVLEGFTFRGVARRPPGPGEVEIRVDAIGLNFRDVLVALGLVPPVTERGPEFGFECAGRIVAVGAGVDRLAPGERVLAAAPGCFGAFVTAPAALVAPVPDGLDLEEAATIPVAFLTAYHALCELARLGAGERVLIHAAAGGVGQAAVQLALDAGAEVFATAGSPEKREFLRAQGVHHVFDSRSLAFADEILALTGGRGVDVVLNSLAGEFIPRSLAILAPGGRFVEIGKVDVLRNSPLGLRHLEKNVSLFVVDLGQLFAARPAACAAMLAELVRRFEAGRLRPLARRVFPLAEAEDAFRFMARAGHIGKIVVSVPREGTPITPPAGAPACRADATYLVTGGLGGLGLAVAGWLVGQGARHLVLVGRTGAASPEAAAAVDRLRAADAEVVVARADVADAAALAAVLDDARRAMPPLAGVVHAAGVLDDGILLQLDTSRFETVMRPKAVGAWNLHGLTRKDPLDFFVLFSSAAAVLGSPGQGNYVAANAFLDALAHHRRALGLPALAIDWGAWADVGMAARAGRAAQLARQGIRPIAPADGLTLLGRLLARPVAQVMAADVDWTRLFALRAPVPLLAALADEIGTAAPARARDGLTRQAVLAADPADRGRIVEEFLRDQLARVLKTSAARIDIHQPLNRLGIDSLMAVEMKTRIESQLELAVPVPLLLKGPTLAQMTAHLVGELGGSARVLPPVVRQATPERLLARVDDMTDAEIEILFGKVGTAAPDGPGVRKPGEVLDA